MKRIPVLPIVMLLILALPILMWWAGDTKTAIWVGLYVIFCIPSMIQICWVAWVDKEWPKIVSGPSLSFGKHKWPKNK